jgi:hypothetical protein
MKNLPLIQKIFVLGVSFGLAILGTNLISADRMTSMLLSLVAALVIDSVFTFLRTESAFKKLDESIASFGLALAADEGRRQVDLEAIVYAAHTVAAGKMASVWKRLNWAATSSYRATNYIEPTDIYGPQQAKDVFLIQEAKARADKIPIKKVLIVDAGKELDNDINRETVTHHLKAGIQLRWILRDKLNSIAELRDLNPGCIDFAVIDERIVLIWHLTDKRNVKGGEIRIGRDACRPFVDFFDALHNEASAAFPTPPTPAAHP